VAIVKPAVDRFSIGNVARRGFGVASGCGRAGAVHGVEPGHGWPVAASYALNQANKWVYGFAASLIIGVGHLVSSIAMVAVFFYAKAYFELTEVDEPLTLVGDIQIGGPVSIVAGLLLVGLGIREYRHGHSHGTHSDESDDHSHEHTHDHDSGHAHDHDGGHAHDHDSGHAHDHDSGHAHDHDSGHAHGDEESDDRGLFARVRGFVPFVGGHSHAHDSEAGEATERGLFGIAWFAFVLGFAHEEEFEIIALCAGRRTVSN
jgi:ABC-type uncharacterized transport system, permease component